MQGKLSTPVLQPQLYAAVFELLVLKQGLADRIEGQAKFRFHRPVNCLRQSGKPSIQEVYCLFHGQTDGASLRLPCRSVSIKKNALDRRHLLWLCPQSPQPRTHSIVGTRGSSRARLGLCALEVLMSKRSHLARSQASLQENLRILPV